jgi:hypothetical protein
MARPLVAAAVVLLTGAVWVGYLGMGPMEPVDPLDPEPLWSGWLMIGLWAVAAAMLFAHGRMLARLAGAAVLVLAGLAAFFSGVPLG